MSILNLCPPQVIGGDELMVHLLAIMSQIHYCIITKTSIYYSHPNAFPSPSAVHVALVYLGNSIFRDTMTLSKKCPPPPYINFHEPLPGDLTPREVHLKSREHSKEYKIRWPKKRPIFKKCSFCSGSFYSQLELNLHTKSVHKYRFMCSSRQCGKTFGSLET